MQNSFDFTRRNICLNQSFIPQEGKCNIWCLFVNLIFGVFFLYSLWEFLGSIMRKEVLKNFALTGHIKVKKDRGKQRII